MEEVCETDNNPMFAAEEDTPAEWCTKRYDTDMKERKHSAGSLWAFHNCGFSFPPVEMVGPESLTQVLQTLITI